MQIIFYGLFILSGAAGLIYESVWSRYLSLFVGHSAYAQIIVLTIFLGGMSLGAMLVSRRSKTLREPLAWYAYVEMLAGLFGILFHNMFEGVTGFAYANLFPAMADSPMLIVVKWLIAALLILPQSILLGTTFPLMSAGVIRIAKGEPGRVLSLLYFANSLGAAGGVLLAGFVLVEMAGLPGTLVAAAIINIVVGIGTLSVVRFVLPAQSEEVVLRVPPAEDVEPIAVPPNETFDSEPLPAAAGAVSAAGATGAVGASERTQNLWRLLLVVSFGTAVASFIYEIAWIRMLSMVLGSATHSFELMLSAFILGLALGAFWVRKRADSFREPIAALGNVQWLMGVLALATLPVYLASFGWTGSIMNAVDRNPMGYSIFNYLRYGVCLAVMLPSTFMAGITLPLITRTLYRTERGESAIGTVYAVNTLGSIAGVAAAGLLLMPILGVKYLLIFGALIDMVLGVVLLAYASAGDNAPRSVTLFGPREEPAPNRRFNFTHPRATAAALLALVAVVVAAMTTRFDTTILSSGVFRTGSVPGPGTRNIVFYRDGRTASVSVSRNFYDSLTVISTNGKPDASLDAPWFRPDDGQLVPVAPLASDVSTQFLLPMVTLAHMPSARVAAVIGHGSGMSSHFMLGSPNLQRLYTIEIEPAMIEGSRNFMPANKRVFEDPRSKHIIDDAKSYFAATSERFDIILSEPSNPWVSGVSGLFTREFYARVKRYLTPDGLFGQWLHLYEINDGLVLSVLAALHESFPSYEIFQTSSGDILILAGLKDSLPTPDWNVFKFPMIAEDLTHAVQFDSLTLEATRVLNRAVLAPILDNWGQPNSDYYPVLDLGTERTRFQREVADGFSSMWTQGFNVSAALMGKRFGSEDDKLAVMPGIGSTFSRALSARARRGLPLKEGEEEVYPGISDFFYREWAFNALLKSDTPPADWNRWTLDLISIEEDLHRGTTGLVHEPFYNAVTDFARRHRAPPNVIQSIRFLRSVEAWDFADVSAAADSILTLEGYGPGILAKDFMRDAGTIAKLKIGDVVGAREFYRQLVTYGSRSPLHLQSRLLDAHLHAAERK